MANLSIVQLIKRISMDVFNASKPCDYIIGKVDKVNPLTVSISQQLKIDDDFLIVGNRVKSELAVNEKVILIRKSGGQQFLIIDTLS